MVFHSKAVHNPAKSRETGVPTYDPILYVRIQTPGDNLQIADRPAKANDVERFPKQYELFKQGRGEEQPGTPVDLLFPDNPEIVATLRHLKIPTVQMLADLNSEGERHIGMGGLEWKAKARRFLDMAKANEGNAAAEKVRDDLMLKIDGLIAENKELSARLTKAVAKLEADPEPEPEPAAPTVISRRSGKTPMEL